MNKNRYYCIFGEDSPAIGTGYPIKDYGLLLFRDGDPIDAWPKPVYEVRNGGLADFMGSVDLMRLCSEELKGVFDQFRTDGDGIKWLPVTLRTESGDHQYWLLYFSGKSDVLDESHTRYYPPGTRKQVIKPVLSERKCHGKHVFCHLDYGTSDLLISREVQRALKSSHAITGLVIEPMSSV